MLRRLVWNCCLILLCTVGVAHANQPVEMFVNGKPLSIAQEKALASLGFSPRPGRFWYDPVSGAFGPWGMQTSGFLKAGVPAAPLAANASNGTSGVFVNGRNLPFAEVLFLAGLAGGPLAPGHYWLDAKGNAGKQGKPAFINFLDRAKEMGVDKLLRERAG